MDTLGAEVHLTSGSQRNGAHRSYRSLNISRSFAPSEPDVCLVNEKPNLIHPGVLEVPGNMVL